MKKILLKNDCCVFCGKKLNISVDIRISDELFMYCVDLQDHALFTNYNLEIISITKFSKELKRYFTVSFKLGKIIMHFNYMINYKLDTIISTLEDFNDEYDCIKFLDKNIDNIMFV